MTWWNPRFDPRGAYPPPIPLATIVKVAAVGVGAAMLTPGGREAASKFMQGEPLRDIVGPPLDTLLSPDAQAQVNTLQTNLLALLRRMAPSQNAETPDPKAEKPFDDDLSIYTATTSADSAAASVDQWKIKIQLPKLEKGYEAQRASVVNQIVSDLVAQGKIEAVDQTNIRATYSGNAVTLDRASDAKPLVRIRDEMRNSYEKRLRSAIEEVESQKKLSLGPSDGGRGVRVDGRSLPPMQAAALNALDPGGWTSADGQVIVEAASSADGHYRFKLRRKNDDPLSSADADPYLEELSALLIEEAKKKLAS